MRKRVIDNNLDKEIIIKRKIGKDIIIWTILTIIFFILSVVLVLVYKIDYKLEYEAQVLVNNDTSVIFYVKDEDLDKLKNKKLYVNNKKTNYDIKEFSKDYYITSDGKNYKQVTLKCILEDNIKINNNIIKLKFIVGKRTIMDYLVKHFKRS